MRGTHFFNLASGGLSMSFSVYHSVTFSGTKNADTFRLLGFSVLQKSSKVCAPLEREPGPVPWLHCGFLAAFPLPLPLPASLINEHLNLPFGTQGRSVKEAAVYSLQKRNGDRKASTPRKPTGSCSVLLFRVLERGERKICSSEY